MHQHMHNSHTYYHFVSFDLLINSDLPDSRKFGHNIFGTTCIHTIDPSFEITKVESSETRRE